MVTESGQDGWKKAGRGGGMILLKEAVKKEVLGWVDEMFSTKQFGSFGIDVRFHEGMPVSVSRSEECRYVTRSDGVEGVR